MAFENSNFSKTYKAASAVNAHQPVMMLGALTPGSAVNETVVPAGSWNLDVLGVARATAPAGGAVTVDLPPGFVKVIAAASLGAGARVAVGSSNGRLVPAALAFTGSTAAVKAAVGIAETSAVDGDIFSIQLKPEVII